jgi:CubicO group peptidase (beta-lactamase class C family)
MVAVASTISVLSDSEHDAATDGLSEVERQFRAQLSPLRLFPGATLAVYCQERLVLNLVGGYADTQRGELVDADSLFPLFSGTKPVKTAKTACWSGTSSPTAAASRRPRRN